ncbi:hypothetical protein BZA05DRAFT_57595 [Tricharina praecox]|uniref:uncharacterized protein n=1 Tax=Tricharina praecox TaxID=43433 RepID=UPI0022203054|nr:uncharacterized protein BZA05DRAFT_57595 [Tricharina praecox]KAI5851046.1 hypothetical protein BZA05DRAFT_57595 [Tricharina praecox]
MAARPAVCLFVLSRFFLSLASVPIPPSAPIGNHGYGTASAELLSTRRATSVIFRIHGSRIRTHIRYFRARCRVGYRALSSGVVEAGEAFRQVRVRTSGPLVFCTLC